MSNIAHTARIYPKVRLGSNVTIEDFCIIGCPPRGAAEGDLETIIGDDAVIRSHTVIYAGNRIGRGFECGNKVNIREQNEIGDKVSIGTLSVVEHHTIIEDEVRIHTQAFVPEYSVLQRACWIGPNVVLTNVKYPKSPDAKRSLVGVRVGVEAKLGANCTILPGLTIGEHSLVGAGSVVVSDVPARMVYVGNPARAIKSIDDLPYRP